MKTLSVQQPWASMICCGLKDVENRTWKSSFTGRMLVHASSRKVAKKFDEQLPYALGLRMDDYRTQGMLDEYEDMPLSAIVGYVDVVGYNQEVDSEWASPDCWHWKLSNAHLFEHPITNVKGKLNLFDYDLDENNLPSVKIIIHPNIEGDELVMPLCKESFNYLAEGSKISYCFDVNLFDENADFYTTLEADEYRPKPLKTICFINEDKSMRFTLDKAEVLRQEDENGNSIEFENSRGETCIWLFVEYELGKRVE